MVHNNNGQEKVQQEIMQSSIGRDKWVLEVERVAHMHKVNKAGSGGKRKGAKSTRPR